MTTHEKTIKLISDLGMTAKKTAEILGKSQSLVYNKIKEYNSNKFLSEDYEKLATHCKKIISGLN